MSTSTQQHQPMQSSSVITDITTTTTQLQSFYIPPNQLQQFFGNLPMMQTQQQQQPGQATQQAFVQYSVPTNMNQQFMQQQQPGQQQQQQYFVNQEQPLMQKHFQPQMMPQQHQQQQVYTSRPGYRQMPQQQQPHHHQQQQQQRQQQPQQQQQPHQQQQQQPSQQTYQLSLKQLQAQHKIKSEQAESYSVAEQLLSLSDDSGSCSDSASDLDSSSDTDETAEFKYTNTATHHNTSFPAVVVDTKPTMGRPMKGNGKMSKQPVSPQSKYLILAARAAKAEKELLETTPRRRGRGPGKNNKGRKPRPRNLELHKKYCCSTPHCDKKFVSPSKLRRHMLVHNGIKQFGCKLCQNRFGQKSALIVHLKRKHAQMLGYGNYMHTSTQHALSQQHEQDDASGCDSTSPPSSTKQHIAAK